MKKLAALFTSAVLFLSLAPIQVSAGGSVTDTGTVRFEECSKENMLTLESESNTTNWPHRVEEPEYCIHVYPDEWADAYTYFYTLPNEAREESGYYDATEYVWDIDRFEDGDKIKFNFSLTGEPDENGGMLMSSTDFGTFYIKAYEGTGFTDDGWYDANLQIIDYGDEMKFIWDPYLEPDFKWYKIVYSTTETEPRYPYQTTLQYIEDRWQDTFISSSRSEDTYYALCVVTQDDRVLCGDGTLVNNYLPGAGIEIPPAGFEDEVLTTFDIYENPFPDTDTSELEGRAAAELYRRAVLGGYPDGEFKGDREVNRAEAAKFLLFARFGDTFSQHEGENGGFGDVLVGEWYARFVVEAARLGIIEGYPDGLFRPADEVNTVEFLKMLSETFDLEQDLPYSYQDVDPAAWYAKYAGIGQKYDLFPERDHFYLNPSSDMTRKEVAIAIYQYLQNR